MRDDLTIQLMRMRVRELEIAADLLAERATEIEFKQWQDDTLFPQAVEIRVWELSQ